MPFPAKLELGCLVAIKCGAGGDDATNRLDAKTNVARAKTTCLFVQSPPWSNGSIINKRSLPAGRRRNSFLKTRTKQGKISRKGIARIEPQNLGCQQRRAGVSLRDACPTLPLTIRQSSLRLAGLSSNDAVPHAGLPSPTCPAGFQAGRISVAGWSGVSRHLRTFSASVGAR